MIEKVLNQKYVDIQPIPFQNDDPISSQLENTGNIIVALQPKSPLHSIFTQFQKQSLQLCLIC